MTKITKIVAIVLSFILLNETSNSQDIPYKYSIGFDFGYSSLSGADSAKYPFKNNLGFSLGFRVSPAWMLNFNYGKLSILNDTTATSSFTIGSDDANATLKWEATKLGLGASKNLFRISDKISFDFGVGSGLMIWNYLDPKADTVVNVKGTVKQTVDYSATEIFVNANTSLNFHFSQKTSLKLLTGVNYLTGAGADFDSGVLSAREKMIYEVSASLNFSFGIGGDEWTSDKSWTDNSANRRPPKDQIDSDGDSVPDYLDRCSNTPFGAVVDRYGCVKDSDGDGVNDGADHCPNTNVRAAGMVDIYGCPIDTDFDGLADYLDKCPNNLIGAKVDASGCPIDSDNDGVPDGLDDCPNSLVGVDVDRNGCIDLEMLSKPLVLYIDYKPGSFDIDTKSKTVLTRLSRLLNIVKEIKLEIYGYTDNIGTTGANRNLSQKRANRVKDFLKNLGVKPERIKAYGRGEENFISSNKTAEGRTRNRRVEIIFQR